MILQENSLNQQNTLLVEARALAHMQAGMEVIMDK